MSRVEIVLVGIVGDSQTNENGENSSLKTDRHMIYLLK
jgi:hypothetical protein